ncbi:MAG TPA: sulfurtransferase TusA family protein [Rhizomicrobium sp.]|nr:sulfurtransferase TusA family protein [Rhizomicrobium sp.]
MRRAQTQNGGMTNANETELDLTGLKCPLPAMFARRALERAKAGMTICVVTDDPMAPIDVPHMCAQEGYECVSTTRCEDGSAHMVLRKPGVLC